MPQQTQTVEISWELFTPLCIISVNLARLGVTSLHLLLQHIVEKYTIAFVFGSFSV